MIIITGYELSAWKFDVTPTVRVLRYLRGTAINSEVIRASELCKQAGSYRNTESRSPSPPDDRHRALFSPKEVEGSNKS